MSCTPASPVIIIHGENMRGKTSLINSIRWGLYGRAKDRRDRPIESYRFINYDALSDGDYHMSVMLDFEHDADSYFLERHIQAGKKPTSDSDLEPSLYLKRNGHFVPTEDIPEVVGNILHEEIARFFFFDGEMLSHFEVLLSEPDREVDLIKDSIEQILGLPALKLMSRDLADLKVRSEKQQLKAVKSKKKSEKLVAETQQRRNESDAILVDIETLRVQFAKVQAEGDKFDEELRKHEDIRSESRTIEKIEEFLDDSRSQFNKLRSEISGLLEKSWWIAAIGVVNTTIEQITAEVDEELELRQSIHKLDALIEHLDEAKSEGECPICGQAITDNLAGHLDEKYAKVSQDLNTLTEGREEGSDIVGRFNQLRAYADSGPAVELQHKETQLRRLKIDMGRHERQLEEIRDRLKGHSIREIRELEEHRDASIIHGAKILESIATKDAEKKEIDLELTRKNLEIQKLPEADPKTAAEINLLTALEEIFQLSVAEFRDSVRDDVEQEATTIFRELVSEEDYVKLSINKQYGLAIIDSEGRDIRDRSAGAEQLVALSLISALNRNAVREGPIIMDTPFGRLDLQHRKNILSFIPKMSSQVILLVQSGEFDRARDLPHIAGSLAKEYRIVRDGSPIRSRLDNLN